ncbi:hypothetical protein ACFW25_40765, partial [Streptomyces tendae]
ASAHHPADTSYNRHTATITPRQLRHDANKVSNHYEVLQTSEFLKLLDRYAGWDWRPQPSTGLV